MKRSAVLFSLFVLSATLLFAVPAKPGWRMVRLTDGSMVKAMRCGDESFQFFKTADGRYLLGNNDGTFFPTDRETLASIRSESARLNIISEQRDIRNKLFSARNKAVRQARAQQSATRATDETDKKRGLVVMVSFSDLDFRDDNAWTEWNDILNKDGYSNNGSAGSVSDYFYDQSLGQFDLTFDLVGPVKLPESHYYYGDNGTSANGLDINLCELIDSACHAIDDAVDFSIYDWDDDGEVDQVFFLYAGCGEHSDLYADTRLIWPHEYWLEYYDGYENGITLDGVKINTYACGSELDAEEDASIKPQSGLGVFCHEFSHCLGLPDLYDTLYGADDMLDSWDLLSYGCYNADGWCPPNYSGYERAFCGWQEPTLLSERATITNMQPLDDGGDTYKVVNDDNNGTNNEYYIIENRQQKGWDTYLPGAGVLITHIYYRKIYWDANSVNTNKSYPGVAIIPADNVMVASGNVAYPYTNTITGVTNDELTDQSKPAAKTYLKNKNGVKYMNKPITDIAVADGIASFEFMKSTDYNITLGINDIYHEGENAQTDISKLYGKPATIYNAQGTMVYKTDSFGDTSHLAKGIYIIKGVGGATTKIIR